MNDHDTPCFARGCEDGGHIERGDGAQVDDFGPDSLSRQRICRRERVADLSAVAYNGHVGTLANDVRSPQRCAMAWFGEHSLRADEAEWFDENAGIVVEDAGGQQPICICGVGRYHYLQPGRMREPRLQHVGMLAADAEPG